MKMGLPGKRAGDRGLLTILSWMPGSNRTCSAGGGAHCDDADGIGAVAADLGGFVPALSGAASRVTRRSDLSTSGSSIRDPRTRRQGCRGGGRRCADGRGRRCGVRRRSLNHWRPASRLEAATSPRPQQTGQRASPMAQCFAGRRGRGLLVLRETQPKQALPPRLRQAARPPWGPVARLAPGHAPSRSGLFKDGAGLARPGRDGDDVRRGSGRAASLDRLPVGSPQVGEADLGPRRSRFRGSGRSW